MEISWNFVSPKKWEPWGGVSSPAHAGIHIPPGQTPPPGRHHPPPADGHCCGRYASYWNAFLYKTVIGPLSFKIWWVGAIINNFLWGSSPNSFVILVCNVWQSVRIWIGLGVVWILCTVSFSLMIFGIGQCQKAIWAYIFCLFVCFFSEILKWIEVSEWNLKGKCSRFVHFVQFYNSFLKFLA